MYFYAARQPILDKDKNLFAYELLFRDSLVNVFPDVDGDEATSKMVEASQFNMGITDFTGKHPAFINFTLETLAKGFPYMLTPEELVVEVLETIKPGKKLLALCKELHEKGYTLALDDYDHKSVWAHFYPYVKMIKIDFLKTSIDEIVIIKNAIINYPHIQLLAEKIETHEQYNQALELGFEYFQGYFFAKPEMVKTKNLSPSQVALAELLYESSKPDLDLAAITSVFERDVSLSYKLLRYANSPMFRRRNEISTIKQALVTLGLTELKRFIGLMFAANINSDKPSELINMTMTRAKFLELITGLQPSGNNSSIAFLCGLLSMIDAILDEDIQSILAKLPIAQEIKDTLLTQKGAMASILKLVDALENADWDKAEKIYEALKLDKEIVLECYNNALAWSDEQAEMIKG